VMVGSHRRPGETHGTEVGESIPLEKVHQGHRVWRVKRETWAKCAIRSPKFWVRSSEHFSLQTVSLVSPFPPVSRAKTVFPQPANNDGTS
jgi:hypothetical protein